MNIKILIADDHRLMRAELSRLIAEQPDMILVGEADNGASAAALASELRPDIIVMDVSMPVLNGIEATRRITATTPEAKVLAFSLNASPETILEMRDAGASGYILKDCLSSDVIETIRALSNGDPYFSSDVCTIILHQRHYLVPKKALSSLKRLVFQGVD